MKNLWIKFKLNFPQNKKMWKAFTLTAVPVIFSSLLFALNSFVDNFMAINIAGANQALAYANAWTEIQLGIVSTTTIVGTALFSQYVGKQDWKNVTEVMNLRILFALGIAIIFFVPCIAAPTQMIQLVSSFDNEITNNIRQQAENYLRLITISWLLNAYSFTQVMILRERNHGLVSFISSLITLGLNVILNSIFIYVVHYGIEFLAVSTIISLVIETIFLNVWIWFYDRKLVVNPLKIFKVSSHITKQFFKRIWSFLLFSIGSLTITIRFVIWNKGYPTDSIGNSTYHLSSATILGITGMFFNIFWTTFESLSATVAVYVGKELGDNKIEEAKINAKQLQGYHLVLGLIIGSLAITFSFIAQHMDFLADGYIKELKESHKYAVISQDVINAGKKEFLENIKWTLLGISVFIPMFVWFVSRDRIISVGGLTNTVAAIEAIVGVFQVAWLVAICLGFNDKVSFAWAYFLFFCSDIPKAIVYEVVFYKVNWARNVTHAETID